MASSVHNYFFKSQTSKQMFTRESLIGLLKIQTESGIFLLPLHLGEKKKIETVLDSLISQEKTKWKF